MKVYGIWGEWEGGNRGRRERIDDLPPPHRQPRRDRGRGSRARPARWASRRSACLRRVATRAPSTSGRWTARSPSGRGRPVGDLPLDPAALEAARASRRRRRPSGLRLPLGERGVRPRRRAAPGSSGSARRRRRSRRWATSSARATRWRRRAFPSSRDRAAGSSATRSSAPRRSALGFPAPRQGLGRRRRQGDVARGARRRTSPPRSRRGRRVAQAAFGDGAVYLERLLEGCRHVEFQVFGDRSGSVVHLFERECSVQRRHQKIVEETPSPALDAALRARDGRGGGRRGEAPSATSARARSSSSSTGGRFYFLEMNTRLQVEHPITEETLGIDLVRAQIEVAAGRPLPAAWRDGSLSPRGHAIELRLYAEDPDGVPAALGAHPRRTGSRRARASASTPASRKGASSGSSTTRCSPSSSSRAETATRRSRARAGRSRSGSSSASRRTCRCSPTSRARRPFRSGRYTTDLVAQHPAPRSTPPIRPTPRGSPRALGADRRAAAARRRRGSRRAAPTRGAPRRAGGPAREARAPGAPGGTRRSRLDGGRRPSSTVGRSRVARLAATGGRRGRSSSTARAPSRRGGPRRATASSCGATGGVYEFETARRDAPAPRATTTAAASASPMPGRVRARPRRGRERGRSAATSCWSSRR